MLNTSNQFKNELYNDNRDYLCYADITLADGTVLNLEDANIWTDSFSIEDAVSGTSSFDIGAAIINKLTLSINNIYEEYSEYDFTDAVVVPYVGLELQDGTIEKIRKGVFTVDEASYDGSLITLSCLDNMYKLDYAYAESKLDYPATLGEIVRDICYVCGVTLLTTTFFNSSYVVQNRPDDQALTCRQVLSWAAQIACSWVRCDIYGRLRLDWYDLSVFENLGDLNGGIFDEGNPYQSGDTAFGGTFNPWTVGDSFNGGTFKDLNCYHHIYSLSAMQICTDDVIITGLKVTESFEETDTDKVQSFLFGTEGYVIAIEGNDLIQKGVAETVAGSVGGRVVGMRFRPFDVSALNDPSMEAGDPVIVTDRKEHSYQSYITSTTFKVGNYQQVQCSAETPSRNSAQRFSEVTRNIVKARWEAAKKISDYDKVMQMLTNLITQSFGVFKTEEKLEDGSTIFYLHDKPTLNQSMTIWKMTADAFAVTTDGGKTWNAGMDSQGNVVVNVLSAIGINAEWINTGELVVKDDKGNVTLFANVDTGRVVINAESVSISGKAASTQEYADSQATSAAKAAVNGQTQTDILNKLTRDGKDEGIYLLNGKLYISFSAARGGELVLGGINNTNGKMTILSSSGETIGAIDMGGVNFTKGIFSTAETISAGTASKFEARQEFSGSSIKFLADGKKRNEISRLANFLQGFALGHYETESLAIASENGIAFLTSIDKKYDNSDLAMVINKSDGKCVEVYGKTIIHNSVEWPALQGWGGATISSTVGGIGLSGKLEISGNFSVTGTKSRVSRTGSYGDRLLYCYEMPSPMFGDIGEGVTDENGECYVDIGDIFSETVATEIEYQVFLQREGEGDIWVAEKNPHYFLVKGTKNLKFAWEVKAKQKGFEFDRLENYSGEPADDNQINYEAEYMMEMETLIKEQEDIFNETT